MSEIHCYTSTRKVKKYVIAYENIHKYMQYLQQYLCKIAILNQMKIIIDNEDNR